MKVIDLLQLYKSVFRIIDKHNIDTKDRMFIDMIRDYNEMAKNGAKETEIRKIISKKYNLSVQKLCAITRRLNKDIPV